MLLHCSFFCFDLKSNIKRRVKGEHWGKVKACVVHLFALTSKGVGQRCHLITLRQKPVESEPVRPSLLTIATKKFPNRKSTPDQSAFGFAVDLGEAAGRHAPWDGRKKSWELLLLATADLRVGSSLFSTTGKMRMAGTQMKCYRTCFYI